MELASMGYAGFLRPDDDGGIVKTAQAASSVERDVPGSAMKEGSSATASATSCGQVSASTFPAGQPMSVSVARNAG